MRPFRLPGAITPDTLKAMLLRLDDDDDEAEQKVRMELERRTARDLRRVFNDMLDTLFPEGFGEWEDPNIAAQRVRDRFREEQELYDVLSRAIQDGADLGVSVSVNQLANIGYGFDYTLAHTQARAWAARYVGELISGITQTTVDGVRQATARWIESGEPLEALIQDLQPYFGRRRAELVAATEVTRSFSEGAQIAYRESGVVSDLEWQNSQDERVCPICGPRQGRRTPLHNPQIDGIGIPAHPSCRCWWSPVVAEPGD